MKTFFLSNCRSSVYWIILLLILSSYNAKSENEYDPGGYHSKNIRFGMTATAGYLNYKFPASTWGTPPANILVNGFDQRSFTTNIGWNMETFLGEPQKAHFSINCGLYIKLSGIVNNYRITANEYLSDIIVNHSQLTGDVNYKYENKINKSISSFRLDRIVHELHEQDQYEIRPVLLLTIRRFRKNTIS